MIRGGQIGPRTVLEYTESRIFGGAEQELLILLSRIDRSRWRPVLVHHGDEGISRLFEEAASLGIDQRIVPRIRGSRDARGLARFARVLRAEHASIFHAHLGWPAAARWGLVAARLAGVRTVVATVQLYMPIERFRTRLAVRVIARWVDGYVAVSNDVRRRLHQELAIPLERIVVIHNTVPEAAHGPGGDASVDGPAVPLPRDGEQAVALVPARLVEQKGHRYLLDAVPLVRGVSFVLVGDGPLRRELESRAARLGVADRIHFLGERRDVRQLIGQADLVVLPSLYEGLPLTVLEAMAASKPVVATAIPGTDEAVADRVTGLLVPPRDPQALARAIESLVRDPERATRLGAEGRARYTAEFTPDTMVRAVSSFYGRLVEHG